jgi:hypothetical protein
MLLPVTINGVRLIALLDSGSTHNFLSVATMRCLGLQLSGAEQLSVTVANGDRLACQGARQVPILIGDEHFSVNCIVLVFFDDILIYSSSWAERLQHVAIIFNELRAHHLHLKRSKCSFGTTSVAYLGHVISAEGIAMDADKVTTVAAWPTPQSPRALRGFLGLAGYYQKFIREFGLIVAPLTRLLRRDAFSWGIEVTEAFQTLKQALTTGPVL